jgi:hypothetical protein
MAEEGLEWVNTLADPENPPRRRSPLPRLGAPLLVR